MKSDRNFCFDSLNAKTGDVLFVKSQSGFIDYLINLLTKSNFTHSAILIDLQGLWFVIETRYKADFGYQIVPLDWWLTRHIKEDIYYGKMPTNKYTPKNKILLKKILMSVEQSLRPYKLSWLIITYLCRIFFGICRPNLNWLYKGAKPLICSTLVQEAWEQAGIIKPTNYMTPSELVDFMGGEENLTPFSNSINANQNKSLNPVLDEEINYTLISF